MDSYENITLDLSSKIIWYIFQVFWDLIIIGITPMIDWSKYDLSVLKFGMNCGITVAERGFTTPGGKDQLFFCAPM